MVLRATRFLRLLALVAVLGILVGILAGAALGVAYILVKQLAGHR